MQHRQNSQNNLLALTGNVAQILFLYDVFSPLFRVAHVVLVDRFTLITQTINVKQTVQREMYHMCY